jgi:hypothetical protein
MGLRMGMSRRLRMGMSRRMGMMKRKSFECRDGIKNGNDDEKEF